MKKTTAKSTKKKGVLTIPVYNIEGRLIKRKTLPKEIFSVEVNKKLLTHYVRVYLANQRQGTASTKTRSEVKGSTRKIYRQKGTGRARHGAITAPIFVGGGVVGGPRPTDYSLKMNKKQKRKAFLYALSLIQKNNSILELSGDISSFKAKTKIFADFLKKLDLHEKKILLVLPKFEKNNLVLASRNVRSVILRDINSLNAYDLLNTEKVILADQTLKVLEKRYHEN